MKHEQLSKRRAIHLLQLCGLIGLFLLAVPGKGYPVTVAEVRVQESDMVRINDTGPTESFATLTRTLGSGEAEVDISEGILRTRAYTSTSTSPPSSRGVDVAAVAMFEDFFTVQGLPEGRDWIDAYLHVTGTIYSPLYGGTGSPYNYWSAYYVGFGNGADETIYGDSPRAGSVQDIDVTVVERFVFLTNGVPFWVTGSLESYAHGWDGNNPYSDLSHTATLWFDLPEGATIFSTGGFLQHTEPVPEPSTILLLGSGLVAMIWKRRKGF